MSVAGRAAIAAAQKARWAKQKRSVLKFEAPKVEFPKFGRPAKRKMSAAGRARIIAAQKARWAKAKVSAEPSGSMEAEPAKKRKKMSATSKAKIAAAAKARWAKVRAETAAK